VIPQNLTLGAAPSTLTSYEPRGPGYRHSPGEPDNRNPGEAVSSQTRAQHLRRFPQGKPARPMPGYSQSAPPEPVCPPTAAPAWAASRGSPGSNARGADDRGAGTGPRRRVPGDPEIGNRDLSAVLQARQDPLGRVDRDGERDPDAAAAIAASGGVLRVDPDHPAVGVEQRAAR